MSEQWVTLQLRRREALVCHTCAKTTEDQEVHMYVNVDSKVNEVMCLDCWKKATRRNDFSTELEALE